MIGIGLYNWLKVKEKAAEDQAAYIQDYQKIIERSFGENAVYFAAAEVLDESSSDEYDDTEAMLSHSNWRSAHDVIELR
jgi:GH25 family lysozyme M1 (1,4-beta-N-acetylmuramidase)